MVIADAAAFTGTAALSGKIRPPQNMKTVEEHRGALTISRPLDRELDRHQRVGRRRPRPRTPFGRNR